MVRGRPLPWSRRGRGLRESDKTGQPRAAALEVLAAWLLAATIAAALDACTRLLLLHDEPELVAAEPQTIRMKLYHLPARARARRTTLERSAPHHLGPVEPDAIAALRDGQGWRVPVIWIGLDVAARRRNW